MKFSLHNHSNYSDGIHSVESILKKAGAIGMDVISITDHNEIRGSLRAFKQRDKFDVEVLLGMELFFWYKNKITELLVYFRKPAEITGFFHDFIGKEFIPTVKNPAELSNLVKKYNGMAVMPHPLAHKGCIRNGFDYPTTNIETINKMTHRHNAKGGKRNFAGGDMHFYMTSLGTYSELVGGKSIDDLFDDKFVVKAHAGPPLSAPKRIWQRVMITPLDIKYLLLQIVRRKLLRKTP